MPHKLGNCPGVHMGTKAGERRSGVVNAQRAKQRHLERVAGYHKKPIPTIASMMDTLEEEDACAVFTLMSIAGCTPASPYPVFLAACHACEDSAFSQAAQF